METNETRGKMNNFGETMKQTGLAKPTVLGGLFAALLFAGAIGGLLETNEAGTITVKQSAMTGAVDIISKPGLFCQCLGSVTKYPEAGTVKFAQADQIKGPNGTMIERPGRSKEKDPSLSSEIEVRFNDGGLGWISVMTMFDLPADRSKLRLVHKKFRDYNNLLEMGVKPTIEESVVLTAALMNSGESYTTKRAIFSEWAKDQLTQGTYMTEEVARSDQGTLGGAMENNVVRVKVKDGAKLRNEDPLARYGIKFKQFQITNIRYEAETESLIKIKRNALQQTIVARIAAERAKQERLAAEEFGKKKVKIAEYEGMVKKKKAEVAAEEEKSVAIINAERKLAVAKVMKQKDLGAANKKVALAKLEKEKAIITADKGVKVAKLNVDAAKYNKRAQILEGEGVSEQRRLIYKADGALEQKLDAYVKVMTVLSKELGKQKWVPDIVMNGSGNGGADQGNAAAGFMNLWMMKAAKDLDVELTAKKK
ncbi:MAG: cell envelope integrity protein TolA [Gammaproteobacteria bacterium]|nr:cell envelope integrity protein TolA [Gammaproteobacteria bacterium]